MQRITLAPYFCVHMIGESMGLERQVEEDFVLHELKCYVGVEQWRERLGVDDGVLVSSLFDVMFEMFVNLKLITQYRNDFTCPTFSLRAPGETPVEDLYDTLFAVQVCLIALTEAGPSLPVSSNRSYLSLLDLESIEVDLSCLLDGSFRLAMADMDTIRNAITVENSYGAAMFGAIIDLAGISGDFCLESIGLLRSDLPDMIVAEALRSSYVEEAKRCVAMDYLAKFQRL